MAITDKIRKILWAKSGNKCSICKKELIDKIGKEGDFIIGEECHIISSQPNGPRHKSNIENYDTYDNLILLCRNHHREIDSNVSTYTEEMLQYLKTNHENWVRETLKSADHKEKEQKPRFLKRITSGKELANILNGVYGFYKDYDDNLDKENIEYIASIFQELSEYIDIYGDLEPYDQIKTDYDLNNTIKDLKKRGFYLFADRHNEKWKFINNETMICPICTLIIKKQDSNDIIKPLYPNNCAQ